MIRETSREAYHKIVNTMAPGLRKKICEVLLYSGRSLTASEICASIRGSRLNAVSPRMKELIDRDLVEEMGTRYCGVTGHCAIVYQLTGRPEQKPDKDLKPKRPTKKQIEAMFERVADLHNANEPNKRGTFYDGMQRALGWVTGFYCSEPTAYGPDGE